MPRSIRINPSSKETANAALVRHGFTTQGALATHLEMSLSTINNFFTGKSIYTSNFEEICHALDLDPQSMARSPGEPVTPELNPQTQNFSAFDDCWVGRQTLIDDLQQRLNQQCRLLMLLGIAGIGKTALAENLCWQRQDWFNHNWAHCQRLTIDEIAGPKTFVDAALNWLDAWNCTPPLETRTPEFILQLAITYLCEHRVLLLIDSLENLLTDDTDSGEFSDPLWQQFFLGILSASDCQGRIILTSQEFPLAIAQGRYRFFWHRQILKGLEPDEQTTLFHLTGLDLDNTETRQTLERVGAAYEGHPLVLRVIIGEIWESYQGNVTAYWNEIKTKIETVETAILEAQADANKIAADDDWKLHKLTRKVRLEINKQRFQSVFNRLETQCPDAYWLLCMAAIYRLPVQVSGWLMQLATLVRRIEGVNCPQERQEEALAEICFRFLVEESIDENNQRTLGLHQLIRSIALERRRQLLDNLAKTAKTA